MLKLNFFGGNYCPNKVRSYHLDFPVNLIKIISSDTKDNTQYRKNLLPPTKLNTYYWFRFWFFCVWFFFFWRYLLALFDLLSLIPKLPRPYFFSRRSTLGASRREPSLSPNYWVILLWFLI